MSDHASPMTLGLYVRLALGLPEAGELLDGTMAAAVRAGINLDSFTASETVRLDEIKQSREQQRGQRELGPRAAPANRGPTRSMS